MKRDAATSALSSYATRMTAAFAREESGAITPYGLILFIATMAISATALDVSRLMSVRSHLQLAADAGAHAALYLRDEFKAEDAIAGALDLIEADFPRDKFGLVVDEEDIAFGRYDETTRAFTEDENSREAARVVARMNSERANAVQSFLFKLVGYDSFDVATQAIYETYRPTCLTEGFVAEGVVDVQSNNLYTSGFCVHSNTYVSLNSNNIFEPGSIVSMPNPEEVDLPNSGFETNDGLEAALRVGKTRLRILDDLDDIIEGLKNADEDTVPGYIFSTVVLDKDDMDVKSGKATIDNFTVGRVHNYQCAQTNGNLTITTDPGAPLHDIVLVTNCEIKFSEGAELYNVVIATTSDSAKSMNAPNGLKVGLDDGCDPTNGDSQLISKGTMDFASGLSLYGAQLMAEGDIKFTANANGIEGASLIAKGEIDGESNMAMGYCGSGIGNAYEAEYFRLRL